MANAYFDGLEARLAAGKSIDKLASVASFFLSRIDTLVDKQLDDLAAKGKAEAKKLRGKSAVASAAAPMKSMKSSAPRSRWKALVSQRRHVRSGCSGHRRPRRIRRSAR